MNKALFFNFIGCLMSNKKLAYMEFIGSAFVFAFGMLVKYAFTLSEGDVWSYFISSVNNSAWEQMKPFTFPFFIWSVIELAVLRLPVVRFVPSKVAVFYIYWSAGLFYMAAYNSFFDGIWRILLFVGLLVIILISHYISYVFITKSKVINSFFIPSLIALVMFIAMFIVFTPYAPHGALFYDSTADGYGLSASEI